MPLVEPGDAQPPLLLVLDAGSSSLRATLFDTLARPVQGCAARAPLELETSADGAVEVAPEVFVHRFAALIDEVLQRAGPSASDITAVGMAAFAATVTGIDEHGRAITPGYLYSDTRPAAQVRQLRRELDETAVHQRTGCRLHSSYLPARLRWLEDTVPEQCRRVRQWLSLPDYLYLRLFGRTQSSISLASWSGLLNRHTLSWDASWLHYLRLSAAALPVLSGAPLTGMVQPWAQRWPSLAAVPWFPAWGDGAASNIGSGCARPGRLALNIGTSAALRLVTPSPPAVLPPGLWCYRVDETRALVGGALSEGGGTVAWVRRTMQIGDMDRAEQQIAQAEPDGHGLSVLPFLAGERSPGWNPEIRFTLAGANLDTTPVAILQAVMEGVAYRLAMVARELEACVPGSQALVAGGGGATGAPVWLQIIADVLGQPVRLPAEPEPTSRGVALLLLEALGRTDVEPDSEGAAVFEPRPQRTARYESALTRQQVLYERLAEWHAFDDNVTG